MKLVYVVDDDFDILQSLSKWLTLKRFSVRAFSGSTPLYAGMEAQLPDVVLLDIVLGREDGRDICKEIKQRFSSRIPVILYSSFSGSLKEAKDGCADDFVDKYSGVHEIITLLESHMKIEPH